MELFRPSERIHIRTTVTLHQLRSRPVIRQLSSPSAFCFEHFAEIFQRQCDISIYTKSVVATIYRLRRTLHCAHGDCEFLSVLENRKEAIAYWLHARFGSHLNVWQSTARNRLQSHDTRTDLGRIYGEKTVSLQFRSDGKLLWIMLFQELLGYSLPLINYHYVRRKFRGALRYAMGNYTTTDQIERLRPKLTINTKCEYCSERPTLPHHMGCKHVFCYYCLQVWKQG